MRQGDPIRKGQRLYGRHSMRVEKGTGMALGGADYKAGSCFLEDERWRRKTETPNGFCNYKRWERGGDSRQLFCTGKSTEKITEVGSASFIPPGILHQTVHCLVGDLSASTCISLLCAYVTHLQNNPSHDCMEVSWGVTVAAFYSAGLWPYVWNTEELQLQLVNLICSSTTRTYRKNLVMFPALKPVMKRHLGRKNCACSIKSCILKCSQLNVSPGRWKWVLEWLKLHTARLKACRISELLCQQDFFHDFLYTFCTPTAASEAQSGEFLLVPGRLALAGGLQ